MKSVTLVAVFTVFVLAVGAYGPPQHSGKQYGKQVGHHGAAHVASHGVAHGVGHAGAFHSVGNVPKVGAHSSSFAHSSASAGSFSHGASHGGHSKVPVVHGHGHGGHIGH